MIQRPRRSSYPGLEAWRKRRASAGDPDLLIRRRRRLSNLRGQRAAVIADFHRNTAGERTTNIIGDNPVDRQNTL